MQETMQISMILLARKNVIIPAWLKFDILQIGLFLNLLNCSSNSSNHIIIFF